MYIVFGVGCLLPLLFLAGFLCVPVFFPELFDRAEESLPFAFPVLGEHGLSQRFDCLEGLTVVGRGFAPCVAGLFAFAVRLHHQAVGRLFRAVLGAAVHLCRFLHGRRSVGDGLVDPVERFEQLFECSRRFSKEDPVVVGNVVRSGFHLFQTGGKNAR